MRNNYMYSGQGFVEALIAIVVAGIATLVLMSVAIRTLNEVVKNELLDQLTQEATKGSVLTTQLVEEYNESGVSSTSLLPIVPGAGGNVGSCYALDGEIGSVSVSPTPIVGCNYQRGASGSQSLGSESGFAGDTKDDGKSGNSGADGTGRTGGSDTGRTLVNGINPSQCVSDQVQIENSAFVVGEEKEDVFRFICIHPDSNSSVLVAKIYTGNMSCSSLNQVVSESVGVESDCNIYEYTGVYYVNPL